jgi:23S rRNA (uracil1939-C5)-methyltransferase
VPDVDITSVTVGAAGVGRLDDGRVVFVSGALPGERVEVEITEQKERFARGVAVGVLEPLAPGRRVEPCPFVADGCGGCDLQHAHEDLQVELKRRIVVESLERLGRCVDPVVEHGPALAPLGYRTHLRVRIADGKPALRARGSHDLVPIDACLTAHPLIDELLAEARFADADEVTLRVGARTGERLALVGPRVGDATFPADVEVVGFDQIAGARRSWFHEEVAGERFRISARSFFQTRPDGADVLVAEVDDAIGEVAGSMVDLYGGVGLFAGTVGKDRDIILVEQNRSSVADARANLGGSRARIVRARVEDWKPSRAPIVVADPARAGLGKAGVTKVAATEAVRLALVSCDPGSLGRDAGLLAAAGYDLVYSRLVDLFPQTSHIEVVSRFDRR